MKDPIVQVSPFFPPHMGGMENVAYETSKALAKSGHDVTVVTARTDTTAPKFAKSGRLRIHRLRSFEFAHTPFMPSLFWRLLRTPKKSIFHIHLAIFGVPEVAMLVAKLRRNPTVLHFHLDVDPSGRLGFLLKLYKKTLFTWTLRHGDAVIVFSKDQARYVAKKYGVRPEAIHILPNGVGEDFFCEPRRQFRNKQLKLLFVGRLSTQKRADRIIEALSLTRAACQLVIVGEGEDEQELKNLVSRLGLKNVTFVGRKNKRQLQQLYASADMLVLPSEKEGMSLVMLEAMAAGLPIIGSDVDGIREYLKNGVGVIVKKPSARTFARALDEVYDQRTKLIPKLSAASAAFAKQYSWKRLTERLVDLYGLVRKSRRGVTLSYGMLSFGVVVWWLLCMMLRTTHVAPDAVVNVVGSSYLLLVPGMLTLMCLPLASLQPFAKFVLAVVFSVLELMLAVVGANTVLQWLGVDRPLDPAVLQVVVSVLTVVLLLLGARFAKQKRYDVGAYVRTVWSRPLDIALALTPLVFIVLSVLGATSLNNGGSNLFTMLMLAGMAIYAGVVIYAIRKVSDTAIAIGVSLLALALLLMTSLRGWYTTGHDIQREFRVFELAKNAGVWQIQRFRDPYNACLSITILPTIFAKLLRFTDAYIYKILFQVVFALTPGVLYLLARRWVSAAAAFVSIVYFMAFPTFFTDMPILNRQEMAFLFFALMLYIIFQSTLHIRLRRYVFLILSVGVVLSHYSTTYSVIIILGLGYCMRPLVRLFVRFLARRRSSLQQTSLLAAKTTHELKRITLPMIVIITAVSFLWTTVLTNTGNHTTTVIKETVLAAVHGFKDDGPKASETSFSLFSLKRVKTEDVYKKYREDVQAKRDAQPGEYYPAESYAKYPMNLTDSSSLPHTAVGNVLSRIGVSPELVNVLMRQGFAKVLQVLILIGLLYILFRKGYTKRFESDYITIALGSMIFVLLQVILPLISVEYGLQRAFQQSLMVLGIFLTLGSVYLCSRLPWKRLKRNGPAIVAVFFLLSSTGFFTNIIGSYDAQLHLNNMGTYYDVYYLHKSEVVSIDWLSNRLAGDTQVADNAVQAEVQTDRYSLKKINSMAELNALNDIYPGLIRRDSYVYLGYTNVVKSQASMVFDGNLLTYTYPLDFLDQNKDLVYSNGTARIYK